jgi:hypothetical protein
MRSLRRHTRPLRAVTPIAAELGFRFDGLTRRGHFKWRNRHGFMVITGSKFDEPRSLKNATTQFRLAVHSQPAIK